MHKGGGYMSFSEYIKNELCELIEDNENLEFTNPKFVNLEEKE